MVLNPKACPWTFIPTQGEQGPHISVRRSGTRRGIKWTLNSGACIGEWFMPVSFGCPEGVDQGQKYCLIFERRPIEIGIYPKNQKFS
jgi:hypothetical protein